MNDAVSSWPIFAGAVGVTMHDGILAVMAPFGLDDLFALRIRPNKRQITKPKYEAKAEKWQAAWPQIRVIGWDDEEGLGD